jgi:glyoxylate reductase
MSKPKAKKPKVVLTYPIHRELIETELKPYAEVHIGEKAVAKHLSTADALISLLTFPVDKELLARAPQLKVVGNCAVGIDNIDLAACTKRGIAVVNTPGVLTRATAELTLALLLAAARRLPEGEALCRKNAFKGWVPDLLLGQELRGRHAVLVGKGKIGRETGKLFQALDIRVSWITRADTEAEIQAKLRQAQILSLHVPLTRDTFHWLNARRIQLLPRDAIVLNTTRGPVVDEKALIQALRKKAIFGAGLDVFEREPEIPAALRKLKNVVLLPHLGSATQETRAAMAHLVIAGVLAVLSGKRPLNQVESVAQ